MSYFIRRSGDRRKLHDSFQKPKMAKWLGLVFLYSQMVAFAFCVPWSRHDILKQVNRKGPYIGLITVYPPEENAFFSTGAFKPDPKFPFLDLSGNSS